MRGQRGRERRGGVHASGACSRVRAQMPPTVNPPACHIAPAPPAHSPAPPRQAIPSSPPTRNNPPAQTPPPPWPARSGAAPARSRAAGTPRCRAAAPSAAGEGGSRAWRQGAGCRRRDSLARAGQGALAAVVRVCSQQTANGPADGFSIPPAHAPRPGPPATHVLVERPHQLVCGQARHLARLALELGVRLVPRVLQLPDHELLHLLLAQVAGAGQGGWVARRGECQSRSHPADLQTCRPAGLQACTLPLPCAPAPAPAPHSPHPWSMRRLASRSMPITRGFWAHLEKSPEGSLVKVWREGREREG